jgi:hypothetical protein
MNGNYEEIVSPIQHQCIESSNFGSWNCVEYVWDIGKLKLSHASGDPYDEGYSVEIYVRYCPFCGYETGKTNERI